MITHDNLYIPYQIISSVRYRAGYASVMSGSGSVVWTTRSSLCSTHVRLHDVQQYWYIVYLGAAREDSSVL